MKYLFCSCGTMIFYKEEIFNRYFFYCECGTEFEFGGVFENGSIKRVFITKTITSKLV